MNRSKHIIVRYISRVCDGGRSRRADGHAPNSNCRAAFSIRLWAKALYTRRRIRRARKATSSSTLSARIPWTAKTPTGSNSPSPARRWATSFSKIEMVVDAGVTYTARTIMQMGNNPPMEMPAAMSSKAQTPVEIKDKADDLGSESVTTPAGTFPASTTGRRTARATRGSATK